MFGCHRGVFETAHGIGENIRGRTLGAIDNVTNSGSAESKSHHVSLADRGRMEAETGMAHISGYSDPNVYRNELGHTSNSTPRTFGDGHATGMGPGTGYVRAEEDDYYGGGGRMDGAIDRRASEGFGRPGVLGFEQKQPAIDRNNQDPITDQSGGLSISPNRCPQNAGSEAGWTSMSQAAALTPTQQRIKRDFPPELPPPPELKS